MLSFEVGLGGLERVGSGVFEVAWVEFRWVGWVLAEQDGCEVHEVVGQGGP